MELIIIGMAIVALIAIACEEITHIDKAKSTLFFGCASWLLLYVKASATGNSADLQASFDHNLLEIASLWLFLMATMTFVAFLNARGLISGAVLKVMPGELSFNRLIILVAVFAVLLSMLADNITATLVSLSVVSAFKLSDKERIKLAVLAVFAVNSGGVILITGDVTTLMIFSDGHLSMAQLLHLLLPTLIGVLALVVLMMRGTNRRVEAELFRDKSQRLDVVIAILFFSTIVATMILNILFSVPPVLTFLSGLSIMFLIGGFVNKYRHEIHLLEYVRKIQFDTLLFFLGILLIVGALKEIGVLVYLTELFFALSPELSSYLMGISSAMLDNVPLTAALLKSEPTLNITQWLGLTYAVGVGGSLLVIGSAAGIVAMSRLKELTFMAYARYIPRLFVAYSAGYLAVLWLS